MRSVYTPPINLSIEEIIDLQERGVLEDYITKNKYSHKDFLEYTIILSKETMDELEWIIGSIDDEDDD